MAIAQFSVKYRPVKIGFLVRKGEINDLIEAAGINSLLWGGIYNPIIPIARKGQDNSLAESLTKAFSPDTFYRVSDADEIKEFCGRYPFLRDPGHYADQMFHEDWFSKKNEVAYLDVLNLIYKLWENDFKHKSEDYKSNCSLVKWSPDDPLHPVFSLLFGYFPTSYNLKDNFERSFVRGLKAQEEIIDSVSPLKANLIETIFPIRFTDLDLRAYKGSSRDQNGVFYGRRNHHDDLLKFWNLRATGSDLIFCPIDDAERFKLFVTAFLQSLDKLPNTHPNWEDWITIHYATSEDVIKEIVKDFKTKKKLALQKYDEDARDGLNFKPSYISFDWQRASGIVEQSYDRYQISLSFPEKKFLGRLSEQRRGIGQQYIAISIDSFGDFSYPGHTLKLPHLSDLDEFFSREVTFDPWKLRTEEDGFALIIRIHEEGDTLYPIPHQKLLDRILEYSGIKPSISQPGLLASKIIRGMRENTPLQACRIFQIRGVRKVLKSIKAEDLIRLNEALRIIGQEGFKQFKTLYIESRDAKELTPLDAFNFLVKKKILKPKLRRLQRLLRVKADFRCLSCGLNSSILASEFENDKWVCRYCFQEEDLRPLVVKEFKDMGIWDFQKCGLFSKNNNQEGAIPVILSLLTFSKIFHSHDFFYSTALNLNAGGRPFETDFLVFQHLRGSDFEIAIGEAKDESGNIDQNDIDNLKIARDKLESKGFSCHLVFSKTADGFSDKELELFRTLTTEHIPIILFTNSELEPYHPYWERENQDRLPHKYALTMSEMADNSRFLYLS